MVVGYNLTGWIYQVFSLTKQQSGDDEVITLCGTALYCTVQLNRAVLYCAMTVALVAVVIVVVDVVVDVIVLLYSKFTRQRPPPTIFTPTTLTTYHLNLALGGKSKEHDEHERCSVQESGAQSIIYTQSAQRDPYESVGRSRCVQLTNHYGRKRLFKSTSKPRTSSVLAYTNSILAQY